MPPKKQNPSKPAQTNKRKHADVEGHLNDAQLTSLLSFLLSPSAVSQFGSPSSTGQKTTPQLNLFDFLSFSKHFTPFQSLASALIMSKPISSRLGVRTVFTLFGQDHAGWDHPKTMLEAGDQGRYEALVQAKTQHKDKTAAQLGSLCQLALDEFMETESDVELSKLRDLAQKDPEALEKSILKVNGVGHLAVDVFERRVQARWSELYPFADDRCLHAADYFGLDAQDSKSLADHVKRLLPCETEEEEREQFAFLVDALVAVDLEHRLDEVSDMFTDSDYAEEPSKKAQKDQKE